MDGAASVANVARNVVAIGDALGNFFAAAAAKIHRRSEHFIGDTLAELSKKINGCEAHGACLVARLGLRGNIDAVLQASLHSRTLAMKIRHALECASGGGHGRLLARLKYGLTQ